MDARSLSISVLIVEDNKDCAESLQKVLEKRTEAKYTVEVAHTVANAVARLKGGGIDAVLLDLSLPDGCGIDVIHRIVQASNDNDVAIVVLTGWGGAAMEAPAKAAGADDFINKPAEATEVSKKLQFVVINRRCEKDRHAIEAPLAELGQIIMRVTELVDKKCEEASQKK